MRTITVTFTHRCDFCKQRLLADEVNDHRLFAHGNPGQRLRPTFTEINETVTYEIDTRPMPVSGGRMYERGESDGVST